MTNHTKLSDAELCAMVAERLSIKLVAGYFVYLENELTKSCSAASWSGIGLVVEAMREGR